MKRVIALFIAIFCTVSYGKELGTAPVADSADPEISAILTVHKIDRNRKATSNIWRPEKNNVFVSVEITVENTSATKEFQVKYWGFKLQNKDGNQFDMSVVSKGIAQPPVIDTTLKKGRKIKGWVSFELPKELVTVPMFLKYEDKTTSCDIVEIP
jgi:hypothetical protein